MMTLPAHRRVEHERTFSRSWSPGDMDPVEGPGRLERLRWMNVTARHAERAMLVLAIVFIVLLCKGLA